MYDIDIYVYIDEAKDRVKNVGDVVAYQPIPSVYRYIYIDIDIDIYKYKHMCVRVHVYIYISLCFCVCMCVCRSL